jgi:hypothetical protein
VGRFQNNSSQHLMFLDLAGHKGFVKGKGKVVPVLFFFFTEHHAMKAYWESGGIAPCML